MKLRNSPNKRLIKKIIQFKPYDYGFLLELEKECLLNMYNFFISDNTHLANSEEVAKDIKLALKLLEIVLDDESLVKTSQGYIYTKYVNTRNQKRFIKYYYNTAFHQMSLRETKAWYLYNKLRYYKLFTFWD